MTIRPALALLCAALLTAVLAGTLGAQEPTPSPTPSTVVRVTPVQQTVDLGTDVSIDIMIDSVVDSDGLGSYEFIFAFDPLVLEFASYSNAAFLGSTGRSAVCLAPLFDVDADGEDDPGFVRVGCVTFGLVPPGPTGSGMLGTFLFTTLCAGSSELSFDLINLSDPAGDGIPWRSEQASVDVESTTPCALPTQLGDVNCDDLLNTIDAALILQLNAGLIEDLACMQNADMNGDDIINSIDSLFVLQIVAGLLPAP